MDDMEKFAVDFDIIRELNPAQVDNVAGGGTESTIWTVTLLVPGTEETIATTTTTWS